MSPLVYIGGFYLYNPAINTCHIDSHAQCDLLLGV